MFADVEFVAFFASLCLLGGMLALIDARHGIIPNWLNLTVAMLGLSKAIAIDGWPQGFAAACGGAVVGVLFWLLRALYFALRKTQGLGLGDVKLLAAAAIWVGITGTPMLLLVAALAALAAAGCMQLAGRNLTAKTSISFGPFLALGLLATLAIQRYGP
jgi:leader peptidase (prepilin peptidase)/N-methyltransferase